MDLFPHDALANLLPIDGIVHYFGPVLPPDEAERSFHALRQEIPWAHDEVVMFGKRIVTARQVAWFGDSDFAYTYSGSTRRALPWTDGLTGLKDLASRLTGATYNSCLLNFYQDGSQGMGWHSDDEDSLVPDAAIASISLGVPRRFLLRHKRLALPVVEVILEPGSLLVMKGATQRHWHHSIPKSAKVRGPRINLTFRSMRTD